jgi:16S rRNA G1207 methylase RsmC
MVPASYFSGSYYLSHAKWVQLWQRSLKIDYLPVVDLKAIKKADNPTVLIPEILKYQTKVKDLISDREWLIELTRQLHKTRSIAIGGVLKSYLRQLEEQFEELPEEDEIENCDRETIYFSWNPHQKIYQKTDNLETSPNKRRTIKKKYDRRSYFSAKSNRQLLLFLVMYFNDGMNVSPWSKVAFDFNL